MRGKHATCDYRKFSFAPCWQPPAEENVQFCHAFFIHEAQSNCCRDAAAVFPAIDVRGVARETLNP